MDGLKNDATMIILIGTDYVSLNPLIDHFVSALTQALFVTKTLYTTACHYLCHFYRIMLYYLNLPLLAIHSLIT